VGILEEKDVPDVLSSNNVSIPKRPADLAFLQSPLPIAAPNFLATISCILNVTAANTISARNPLLGTGAVKAGRVVRNQGRGMALMVALVALLGGATLVHLHHRSDIVIVPEDVDQPLQGHH
jgi:hypothetical protein